MVSRSLTLPAALMLMAGFASAQDESYKPKVDAAPKDPERAAKALRLPSGFKVDLFAAEPLLANPVAFSIDEKGRFYVVETFRHTDGVPDIRGVMHWLEDDLASRTVADRVAMYRKFLKPQEFESYSRERDRIRLVEDTDGDGKADKATVFDDDFHKTESGIAAGVLARKGDVYVTCIPDLLLLKDTDGDGKADVRKVLSTGYGVHNGFIGHDLHGLRIGPDGLLYFSIGDRALNVTRPGKPPLTLLEGGSVLRCGLDGSNLEVVATGLRNPQELAFTETGDLFTVDNNSDGGDRARLVWIVPGADNGWRIGYQFLEKPNSRGIWNGEKMWHPAWEGQAAYLFPPLANFSDGPSGLAYNPGTALSPEFRGHFFLCDFRGGAGNSGVRSFALKPKGAAFELVDSKEFFWGACVTDCDFSLDGSLYVTDWVDGWPKPGKGRIWRVFDPATAANPAVAEVKKLIPEGFEKRSTGELVRLLAHPDMRVRQEAQFALADRARSGDPSAIGGVLTPVALKGADRLARFHAVWCLGQIARDQPLGARLLAPVVVLLQDQDPEVRVQAAKVLGDLQACPIADLIALFRDESPRVRFHALMALRGHRDVKAVEPIVALLRTADGRDPYLRHAAVMALGGCYQAKSDGLKAVLAAADDANPAVRMAVLLTLRHQVDEHVARFLNDAEPAIVLEAARAIVEKGDGLFAASRPKLAALSSKSGHSEALWRRVIAAAEGQGPGEGDAGALASVANRSDVPTPIRVEALEILASWANPPRLHRINGLARRADARPAAPAVEALAPVLDSIVKAAPDRVRKAAASAAGKLGIEGAGPTLRALAADASRPTEARVEALKALDSLKDRQLIEVARKAAADPAVPVRVEGTRILARLDPDAALAAAEKALESGPIAEKQGAFATLAAMNSPKADALLAGRLEKLASGQVEPEIRLDLAEAVAKRGSAELAAKLALLGNGRSDADPLFEYRDVLVGGDAARGGRIFREKAEVQCLRCHVIDGSGGQVGPELTGIGSRKDRAYLLESIAMPNKQIAQGFETLVVATKDGQVASGIVKGQDDKEIRLITAEGKPLAISRSEVEETRRGESAMPGDLLKNLTKGELRDVIEFLATSKSPGAAPAGPR